MEASKQFVQKCDVNLTLADLSFDGEKISADQDEMFIALGVVVVKKLLAEVFGIFRIWVGHVYSVDQQFADARAQLAGLKRLGQIIRCT